MMVIKFIVIILTTLTGYALGYYLTERKPLKDIDPIFDFKAFTCRKCLSTHISWVLGLIASMAFGDIIMAGVAILFSALLFLGLYLDEKERTITI